MKALVKYGAADGDVEIRELPEPEATPGRILVEVEAVGVCGSDLHMWRNTHSWPVSQPVVLGHEMAGRVVDAGGIRGIVPGQRITCETAASVCGSCTYCRTGAYNMCPERRGYGALADGAFTRLLSVRPDIVHVVPDGVPTEHAALSEPVCVAYNALVERTRIVPGDVVVIQGAGAIGIMAAQVARLAGAGTVVMLGTAVDAKRLPVALAVGADHAVDITTCDPGEVVRDLGDGRGADLVVDCTGVSRALLQSMQFVRPLGTIAKIGWGPQPLDFSLDPLVAKAVTLAGSFSHTYETWERVLRLMSTGAVRMAPLVGGVYDLPDWNEAFEAMENGTNVKSVISGF
ncbi:alcohol dehydrogenase/L-iditol 2-dehydrogenase [Nonomuraea polychroma]|uniref:Alcohol dehydrogenase/L-iditol 2-dehydrogenase n=1 Tax=Nonomuraea polychroma TaxID=46176 RepID=A0A438MDT9_9ACTN|nr:zinc-binding dehydrogenase [Nonomuraea polychroma]RVX43912.1 alcohol dehydrogenase/L-iditol 2-dehydrogenase [Nonomuraea polychroma]